MVPTTSYKETSPSTIYRSPTATSVRSSVGPNSPKQPQKPKKQPSLFRRLVCEFHTFCQKLKDFSDVRDPSEDALDSLFESSDDDYFGRSPGKYGHVTSAENEFLLDYKKHRTLEKVYEAHMAQDLRSAAFAANKSVAGTNCGDLQKMKSVLRSQASSSRLRVETSAPKDASTQAWDDMKHTGSTTNGAVSDMNSGTIASLEPLNSADDMGRGSNAATRADTSRTNQAKCCLENVIDDTAAIAESSTKSETSLIMPHTRRRSTCNLGEKLWDERRKRWLETTLSKDKIAHRQAKLSLAHVDPKMHAQIYLMFVEKSKPLKNGTRINLNDLMSVINAGWTKEAKWERAARGLP